MYKPLVFIKFKALIQTFFEIWLTLALLCRSSEEQIWQFKNEVCSNFYLNIRLGGRRKSRNFFSLPMWHHAGRPTTDHCTETIGINSYSPRAANFGSFNWTLGHLKLFIISLEMFQYREEFFSSWKLSP